MKKEIITINDKLKTKRITTIDERWYARESINKETGLPEYEFKPSASWIAGKYPKGIGFYKWLAEHGWDEAEAIKKERGESGFKVHQACEKLSSGNPVKHDDKFTNPTTGNQEELTPEEYQAVISFREWFDTLINPKVIAIEFLVWADRYAGTGDLIVEHGEEGLRNTTLVDLKTSQYIWDSHTIQLNMYFHAPIEICDKDGKCQQIKLSNQAILQIGYRRNKSLYKFTPIEKSMEQVELAYHLWKIEHGEEHPRQIDLPLEIPAITQEIKEEKPKVVKHKKS